MAVKVFKTNDPNKTEIAMGEIIKITSKTFHIHSSDKTFNTKTYSYQTII